MLCGVLYPNVNLIDLRFSNRKSNITQSMTDVILLEALHGYFFNTGGVYARQNNVGTVSFRKISVLKNTIIPFFRPSDNILY